jgi:hypothetical protein
MSRGVAPRKVDVGSPSSACVETPAAALAGTGARVRWPMLALATAGLLGGCNVPLEQFSRADGGSPGPGDAPSGTCDRPREMCGSHCVDLAGSSTNCGRCGHDCGGGACISSQCQPVSVAGAEAGVVQPAALAVNATAIFWTEPTRVRSCPLPAGCTSQPTLIAGDYSVLDALAVTDDAVYFTGCPACSDHHDLLRCPATGCPDPAPVMAMSSSPYEDIVIGNTHAFWRESGDALVRCALSDCAGTTSRLPSSAFGGSVSGVAVADDTVYVKPAGTSIGFELRTCREADGCGATTILTSSNPITPPFHVHAGRAYWVVDGPTGRAVSVCPLVNCRGAMFAAADPGTADIAVDDTGVYWLATSTGALRTCPLTGCPPAGPITLASGRENPGQLTLGAGFFYWIEGNTIVKLARP